MHIMLTANHRTYPVNMPISGQHRISNGWYRQYRTSAAGTGPVLAHHMLPIHCTCQRPDNLPVLSHYWPDAGPEPAV